MTHLNLHSAGKETQDWNKERRHSDSRSGIGFKKRPKRERNAMVRQVTQFARPIPAFPCAPL
jgi:hypothetical protein